MNASQVMFWSGTVPPIFPEENGHLHYILALTNVANIVIDEDICMDLLQHFGLCQASAVPAPEIPDENSVYQIRKVLGDPFACCLFDVLE